MDALKNRELPASDVITMSLTSFEHLFGFRPYDALEKKWFAVTRTRITPSIRAALEAHIFGDIPLDDVVMTDI